LLSLKLRTPLCLITEERGHGLFRCILIPLDTLLAFGLLHNWFNNLGCLFIVLGLGLCSFGVGFLLLSLCFGLVLGLLGSWDSFSLQFVGFLCHQCERVVVLIFFVKS